MGRLVTGVPSDAMAVCVCVCVCVFVCVCVCVFDLPLKSSRLVADKKSQRKPEKK